MWDYSDGPTGPSGWGDLKPEWSVCKSGMQQSPIAVQAQDLVLDRSLGKLDAKYRKKVQATLYNSGHGPEVSVIGSEVLPWRCVGWRVLSIRASAGRLRGGGQATRVRAPGLLLRGRG